MSESPHIDAATAADFDDKVIRRSGEVPVLVDFWAAWCGPCRSLTPVLHGIVEELKGAAVLVTVDTDQEMELAGQFRIRSLPTVKLFKDGRVADEFMGALPASRIRAFLESYIEREPDARVEEAETLARQGDPEGAAAVFEQVLEDDPKDLDTRLRFAKAMLAAGDIDRVRHLIGSVPVESSREPAVLRLGALLDFHALVDPARSDAQLEAGAAEHSPPDLRELAARKVLSGDYDAALALQLELLKTDRRYGDNAAQKDMLSVFEIADNPDLVNSYRRRMASLLY
ncbi:MAG: tetratricopeptide repeat protein [Gammaproteobacteria bacterium]|nr:tetratricopeptide repeat protein [Gammaproteobacteria bacterium]